jgi:hypothetical protein
MKIDASVAVNALAATIQEMGLGSGVILLYIKVLKNWFSTPQASDPKNPRIQIAIRFRFDTMSSSTM